MMLSVSRVLFRWSMLTLFWAAFVVVFLWVVAGICHLDFWMPKSVSTTLGLLVAIAVLIGVSWQSTRRTTVAVLGVLGLVLMLIIQTRSPSSEGEWMQGQEKLALVKISKDRRTVDVRGIRDFSYGLDASVEKKWLDAVFDLEQMDSVWLGVDRFSRFEPIAHTFLSFGFRGDSSEAVDKFVAFSVEARRDANDPAYSPLRGIYNHYELHYVVATERDMLGQRATGAPHPIQLYPLRAEKSRMQKMFLDIMHRIESLHSTPEFYHTIRSNCTNNIVAHANHAGNQDEQINLWQRDVIFPGYTDWLAFEHNVIDTELSLEDAREQFRIDQKAASWDGMSDFSSHIRE